MPENSKLNDFRENIGEEESSVFFPTKNNSLKRVFHDTLKLLLHQRLQNNLFPMLFIAINKPNYSGSKSNHNYYSKTQQSHPHHNSLLNNGYHPSIPTSTYHIQLTDGEKVKIGCQTQTEIQQDPTSCSYHCLPVTKQLYVKIPKGEKFYKDG